jgi:hypothetical protein
LGRGRGITLDHEYAHDVEFLSPKLFPEVTVLQLDGKRQIGFALFAEQHAASGEEQAQDGDGGKEEPGSIEKISILQLVF